MAKTNVLRCLVCHEKFSEEDVKTRTFFPDTSGCFACYKDMSESPFSRTCFGKLNVVDNGKIKHYGYDPLVSLDCSFHCPHRRVCKLFAHKRINKIRAKLLTPFDGAVADAFRLALKGTRAKAISNGLALKKLRSQVKWIFDEKKKVVKLYWIKTVRKK